MFLALPSIVGLKGFGRVTALLEQVVPRAVEPRSAERGRHSLSACYRSQLQQGAPGVHCHQHRPCLVGIAWLRSGFVTLLWSVY